MVLVCLLSDREACDFIMYDSIENVIISCTCYTSDTTRTGTGSSYFQALSVSCLNERRPAGFNLSSSL